MTVALAVETLAWDEAGLGDIASRAQAVFAAAARRIDLPDDIVSEIGLTLADDATVREANAEWRGKDKPTNILSFPMAGPGATPGPLLGDLILAYETVAREAALEDKPFDAHFRHLLVHGFLHLVGYDHVDESEAEAMERLEVEILAEMGIADPYAEGTETPAMTPVEP
ncbi:rRNA maturation RNase YbeY [Aurantimonas aggregata]|uniref:Endoribonuclease YbeY n=1 Tax=Aurantimonas aggregata TaxID=2047720 RepID=A0A6L9MFM5_9HYPH|nr:rRNA maturation RNase YbeY [Aurantimonas aggregata]NDV86392.1 rRNA maturation RNase YbeY [Aurantimonas aggregata]